MTVDLTGGPKLVIVRHGETTGQSSIRFFGRTDVELSDLGRRQLAAAGRCLTCEHGLKKFPLVFSSPLARAIEGARLIAGTVAPIVKIAEFAEVDFGLYEGLTLDEIAKRFPEEFARWNANRIARDYVYPGGESRIAFAERVARGREAMLDRMRAFGDLSGSAVLLVAHRGVIRELTRALAGIEPAIELASIQILAPEAPDLSRWRAVAIDLTAHLSEPEM